ncbi:MAG TPA: gamma-glutamyltransferase [Pyrinomonadaceae bacterium]|nr:gamma-glutamyltransferase [Pyrinomonadaceae bacterium]
MMKRISSLLLLFALLFAPYAAFSQTPPARTAASGWREPVRAHHAMVASTSRLASQIGVEVMKSGGNAVDAAVAVAFALAVVYPEAGNLGGGGFMLIRFHDGKTAAIDYREVAPLAATRDMYLDANGALIKGEGSSTVGYRAPGVPGTVAGLELALKKYGSGRFTWARLIEPARKLAMQGFILSNRIAGTLRDNERKLSQYEDSKKIFLNGGNQFKEDDVLRQPELGMTLARLQRGGAREFYSGRTARLIADDMQRHHGLITMEDLRRYTPKERTPLRSTYRGHEIISMPPPSSGGAVLMEMLNILEGYDLPRMNPLSSEKFHLVIEAMRRAYADRAEYMGDPDFARVPAEEMISKAYAVRQRSTIKLDRASTSEEIRGGNPGENSTGQTTHFSIVDPQGNVVANTYTLNDLYGSGVTAEGTGILLNDEMDDFTSKPGTPNLWGVIQGERNSIVPGKRPLSSMTPTIVLRKDGSVWFAVGARGGARIINAVLQIIINVIDHGMNIQQAIDAPRIHHQWFPDLVRMEPFGLSSDTMRALELRGHKLEEATTPRNIASAEGIMIEEGSNIRLGASDPRNDGVPVGF